MSNGKSRLPPVMKATALCTGLGTGILALLGSISPAAWILPAAISLGTTFYHFAMRLLVGAVVPRFTRHVGPDQFWFRQRSWEARLYAALRVKNWKGGIPTYDPGQFDLKTNSPAQVARNMCNAELVHEVIILLSFIPLFFAIPFGEFPVFLITSVLAALFDSIFVIAQRFNRPRLVRILKKKEAKVP